MYAEGGVEQNKTELRDKQWRRIQKLCLKPNEAVALDALNAMNIKRCMFTLYTPAYPYIFCVHSFKPEYASTQNEN